MTYDWADNKLKLDRAQQKAGINASEYELQREYIALGGKVIGDPIPAPEIKPPTSVETPIKTPKAKAVKPRKPSARSK